MDSTEDAETSKGTDSQVRVYELMAELAAARAAKDLAEARLEFATQDLKRHRQRLEQYRLFAAQWRVLLVQQTEELVGMRMSVDKVTAELAREPDGVVVESVAMLYEAGRAVRRDPWLVRPRRERLMEAMPFEVPELDETPTGKLSGGLDALIEKAGMGARKDGKRLDDPSPDTGCHTEADGSCSSTEPCMHTPKGRRLKPPAHAHNDGPCGPECYE
jgi:hypothetical protein